MSEYQTLSNNEGSDSSQEGTNSVFLTEKQKKSVAWLRWATRWFGIVAGIAFGALFPFAFFDFAFIPGPGQLALAAICSLPAILLEIYIMRDFIPDCFQKFAEMYFHYKNRKDENLEQSIAKTAKPSWQTKLLRMIAVPIALINAGGTFILNLCNL